MQHIGQSVVKMEQERKKVAIKIKSFETFFVDGFPENIGYLASVVFVELGLCTIIDEVLVNGGWKSTGTPSWCSIGTVEHILFAQLERRHGDGLVLGEVEYPHQQLTFHHSGGGEYVARTTVLLILDRSDHIVVTPIERVWCFDIGEYARDLVIRFLQIGLFDRI